MLHGDAGILRRLGSSAPLVGQPVTILRVWPFMDLFDGEATRANQFVKEFLALIDARPLRHAREGPVGQQTRIVLGVIEMGEIKSLEKPGLSRPLPTGLAENFQKDVLCLRSRHAPFLLSGIS
ncbi:MAG: hypothetical protein ACRELG_16145 [Gemmataceae bacterium]